MKAKKPLTWLVAILAVILLALIFAIGQVIGAPDVDGLIYLPMVENMPGIYGRVTDGGVAAPNVALELHRLNVNTFADTLQGTTLTNASGYYVFTNQSSLPLDHVYYVKYTNPGDPARLWRWYTSPLDTYTYGSAVNIGDFDIADIALSSPSHGAYVDLPETFTWVRRPATPSDNYEFDLYEDCENCALFYTLPPLGYAGSYNLTTLPPGFAYDTLYFWEIWVYAPDGGYGISYDAYGVTFTNSRMSAAPVQDVPEAMRERLESERLRGVLQARP
jgi:hypothetical protein